MMEAPPPSGLVVAPMGIGQVLDSGFTLARRNFRLLARIAAWGMVPGYGLQVLLNLPMYVATGGDAGRGSALATLSGAGGGIISGISGWLATVAVIYACSRLVVPTEAGPPDPGQAYREAIARVPSFVLLGIIVVLCSIPLIFIFPLAIYIWVRWSPAFAAIVAERTGPITSLGRGWALTRGSWWHTAMVLFLSGLAIGLVEVATAGVFGAGVAILAVAVNAFALSAVLWAIVNALVAIIATPFSAAVATVLYYELRARSEGFDLEQRIVQLAPVE
jgi:hypothetical protein